MFFFRIYEKFDKYTDLEPFNQEQYFEKWEYVCLNYSGIKNLMRV